MHLVYVPTLNSKDMKKNLTFAVLAVIALFSLNSCEDTTTSGIATYVGKVINEYTDEPFADVDVKITNGDKIHAMTKTLGDGTFSVEVRLNEINKDYYILIGNAKMETKQVEIPAYGAGQYNVGTISIKGPTETPVVETTTVRVDSKTLIFCEGKVVEVGEASVTDRGICWGTSTPTIENGEKVSCGNGKGGFSCSIEVSDVHEKNYYIRAYATNKFGTSYGETIMIDYRNPYDLPTVEEGKAKWIVLPYDLPNGRMGGYNYYSATPSYEDYTAYTSCANLEAYDYNDWELPTLSVLELIYKHKNEIGGFTDKPYWSSSYYGYSSTDHHYYYYVSFSDGSVKYSDGTKNVRPVRQY